MKLDFRTLLTYTPPTVTTLLLLLALSPEMPYAYYMALRVVVFAVCAYVAYFAVAQEQRAWLWTMGFFGMLYNPVIHVSLTRPIWVVINIITAGIFALSIWKVTGQGRTLK